MEDNIEKSITVLKIESCFEKLASLQNDNYSQLNLLKEVANILRDEFSVEKNSELLLEIMHKPLLFNLNKSSEKCKEISLTILKSIISHVSCIDNLLPVVVATFVPLLGISDKRESSEEIRLLEIQLLIIVFQKYDKDLVNYFADAIHILSKCLMDDCPEIKRKSCECISLLAYKYKSHFHLVSRSLIKPLLQNISHQHFKTRVVCVQAIGSVILYGNSEDIRIVITHLAQRLFDHSPAVRLAVIKTLGTWLVDFNDRYSCFQHFIPLMLSALDDEVLDIRSAAKDLWCKAGEQYLIENERDYKDLIDYPKPDPLDYPSKSLRPTLGCRLLVQRHFYNIISPLINDISDWVADTRVKSVKVLYSLILHTEEKIVIKLPSIIEAIVFCAKDEEQQVVSEALSCAELVGYFSEIKLLVDTMLTLVHASPSMVHLSIQAAMLRGHNKSLPLDCFTAICKVLSQPSICRARKANEQANLLLCVDALFISHDKIDCGTSYNLFIILISVAGLTVNSSVLMKGKELLEGLAKFQACSLPELYETHSFAALKESVSESELWTSQNPEVQIFSFLLQSGWMREEEWNLAIPVFLANLKPAKEAKLRCGLLALLSRVAKDLRQSKGVCRLLRDGLLPNLAWAAGEAASALRTVAVATLWEVVRESGLSNEMVGELSAELLPCLTTLSDDDVSTNRLLSCRILDCILPMLPQFVDELEIHKACQEFLPCMEDESDEIRLATTKLLSTYIASFPKDYNWSLYSAYLKILIKNLLIHMNDKDENIRKAVLDVLKKAAAIVPETFEEIKSSKQVINSEILFEALENQTKCLRIN